MLTLEHTATEPRITPDSQRMFGFYLSASVNTDP